MMLSQQDKRTVLLIYFSGVFLKKQLFNRISGNKTGGMAQWIEYLQHIHEDQNCDPQHTHES